MTLGSASRSATRLGIVTAVAVALVAVTHRSTHELAAAAERRSELALIEAVLPAGPFDNEITSDWIDVPPNPELGLDSTHRVYRARRAGKLVGLALRATAPDGYSGNIELMIGITPDGVVTGVRTLAHRETPGLADGIDRNVSDWVEQFDGRSLGSPPPGQWAVRRDGGVFDQFTGATITPRAVVGAVRRSLEWVQTTDPARIAVESLDQD